MASYYATMFIKHGNTTSEACGSFGNISIDGRLSEDNAMDIAREYFKKEAAFKNERYAGFKIEKLNKAWQYRAPTICIYYGGRQFCCMFLYGYSFGNVVIFIDQ